MFIFEKPLVLLAAGFLAPAWAAASTILHTIDPQEYRDEASLYPSVAKVTGSIFGGSGVVIADRWVLTAGHIAIGKTGGTVQVGGNAYTVQSALVHPDYSYPANPYDIGLLALPEASWRGRIPNTEASVGPPIYKGSTRGLRVKLA